MATQSALNLKKNVPAKCTGPEELIRLLVGQVTAPPLNVPKIPRSSCGQQNEGNHSEEIIFDVELDGARYLLVRLPRVIHPRVQLSPREQEIVRMVAQGHPNKIMADVLNISSFTVCTYVRRIFAKLGVNSRAAMVARMLEYKGTMDVRPAPSQPMENSGNSRPTVPAKLAHRSV